MKRFLTFSNVRLALELPLVIAVVAAFLSYGLAARAASPQAPDANYWYVCNASNHVAVFADRVHVYCQTTTPVAGAPALDPAITWFAVPTSPDSAAASRFMSMLQTAFITAKPIWLWVDPNDTSGTSFGCGSYDCRRFYGMEMR